MRCTGQVSRAARRGLTRWWHCSPTVPRIRSACTEHKFGNPRWQNRECRPEGTVTRFRSADNREGARHGRKEASEVACPDREEDASEAQAAEEDLARQVAGVRYASAW